MVSGALLEYISGGNPGSYPQPTDERVVPVTNPFVTVNVAASPVPLQGRVHVTVKGYDDPAESDVARLPPGMMFTMPFKQRESPARSRAVIYASLEAEISACEVM
jgi:hypothetical protein